MRTMMKLLVVSSAFALAPAANAATVLPGNSTSVPGASFVVSGDPISGPVSATFGRSGIGSGAFDDSFEFRIGANGLGSGSITSVLSGLAGSSTDLDFTQVTFSNGTSVFDVPITSTGLAESGSLANVPIFADQLNTLRVMGVARGQGSFGGNLSFVANAVPEPSTWLMMLMGFGGLGLVIRRRRKDQTRVSYAF